MLNIFSASFQMQMENLKPGRKGNLNVATEVRQKHQLEKCVSGKKANSDFSCVMFRCSKWLHLCMSLSSKRQKEILWNFRRLVFNIFPLWPFYRVASFLKLVCYAIIHEVLCKGKCSFFLILSPLLQVQYKSVLFQW
jgi:hypothetical protein